MGCLVSVELILVTSIARQASSEATACRVRAWARLKGSGSAGERTMTGTWGKRVAGPGAYAFRTCRAHGTEYPL